MMDEKTANDLIDKFANIDSFTFNRIAAQAEDSQALEQSGIERITIFLYDKSSILLIKPLMGIDKYILNLFSYGTLNIKNSPELKFEISDIAGEIYRFAVISSDDIIYWVDLLDMKMGEELANFLDIEIS